MHTGVKSRTPEICFSEFCTLTVLCRAETYAKFSVSASPLDLIRVLVLHSYMVLLLCASTTHAPCESRRTDRGQIPIKSCSGFRSETVPAYGRGPCLVCDLTQTCPASTYPRPRPVPKQKKECRCCSRLKHIPRFVTQLIGCGLVVNHGLPRSPCCKTYLLPGHRLRSPTTMTKACSCMVLFFSLYPGVSVSNV